MAGRGEEGCDTATTRASWLPRWRRTRSRRAGSTAPAARWRTASRSASSTCSPTAQVLPPCAPTSPGSGWLPWPTCCSVRYAASALPIPASPRPSAAASASSCSRSTPGAAPASDGSGSPWLRRSPTGPSLPPYTDDYPPPRERLSGTRPGNNRGTVLNPTNRQRRALSIASTTGHTATRRNVNDFRPQQTRFEKSGLASSLRPPCRRTASARPAFALSGR